MKIKDYYVYEITTKSYLVRANSKEQAIDDMEYERDTVHTPLTKVTDREVWAEEKK